MLSPGPTAIFILLLISFFPSILSKSLSLSSSKFPHKPSMSSTCGILMMAQMESPREKYMLIFPGRIQIFLVLDLNELVVRRVGSSNLLDDLLPVEESLLPFLEEDEAVVAQGAPGERQADC